MQAEAGRPAISVIVPVHRGGAAFAQCLQGIKDALRAPDELLVAADGALAEDIARGEAAGARVLPLFERSGPARARNLGVRKARGTILFFVDADVLIPPDALERVAAVFALPSAPAALIGSYDDLPAGTTFLSQYKNLQHHFVHQTGREAASTFWGACGAIRRDIFLKHGGFDERYRRPCVEDIELGYRLRGAGESIRLCRSLQVKHLKTWTAASLLEADFLFRALPWAELILRRRHAPNDLNLDWKGRASAALALLLAAGLALLLAAGLAAGFWSAWLWIGAAAAAGAMLALNAAFYGFLWQRRGAWFALRAIPWHAFYHFYSALGFCVALARHLLRLRGAPWLEPEAPPRPAGAVRSG